MAALRGGRALDAEKSLNLAAGMVLERGSLLLTADVFRIDLRDRLGVTQLFALAPDEVDQLLAEGITSAANLANFRFFANDFETRTEGVDLVASWQPEAWAYGGSYLLDLEAAVRLDASTRLVIGGRNALDGAADLNPNPTVIGNLYSTRAPFDTNGGFYYARLQYRWGGG